MPRKAKGTPKPGDYVRVILKDGPAYEGVLIPSEPSTVVVKLESGYNVGLSASRVHRIEHVAKRKEAAKEKLPPHKPKPGLPTIAILHTGGTIASRVDYETGGVVARYTPEDLIAMFPELGDIANISSRLVSNMQSEEMRFAHYNIMAKEVAKELAKGADGVIITHGTDTLHYSAAGLSFVLQGLNAPVLLVGAQRSSDRGSSDAAMNLICAARFIAKSDFAGVAVCMHSSMADNAAWILPGTRCRKLHTSRRDAFKPVNSEPWAHVHYKTGAVEFLRKDYPKKKKGANAKIALKLFNERLKIGLIKTHTNMFASEFLAFKSFDGLVIEGTGMGHAPITRLDSATEEHARIARAIEGLAKRMSVVLASQCIFGTVDMNVYSPQRRLLAMGVFGNYSDLTPETAFIKLAWMLSTFPKEKKNFPTLFAKDHAGEYTSRAGLDELR